MENKVKILIVGGTGFIGFSLAKKCLLKKWQVTSISTRKPKNIRYLKKVKYLICDISKKKILNKNIKQDYDFVVNLGGHVDHSNIKKTYESHYIGLKNLSNIFLKRKIKKFIQMGSGGEYGNAKVPHKEIYEEKPLSNYFKSKFLATTHLMRLNKKKKFPSIIFRLYQAYGPYQDKNRLVPIVINNCLKGRKFDCTDGKQFRDFIYIDDVVAAIIKSLDEKVKPGQIFNLGIGKPFKVRKLIKFINKKIKKGHPNFGKIKMRKDEFLKVYPSIKKTTKILGWKPKVNLQQGLLKTVKFYRENEKKIF